MSVALLVPENWDVPLLTRWAVHFARAERSDLLVLFVRRRPDKNEVEELSPDFDPEKETHLDQLAKSLPEDFVWQPHDYLSHSDSDIVKPAHEGADPIDDSEDPEKAAKHLAFAKRIISNAPCPNVLKQLAGVSLLIVPRHASVRIGGDEFEMERILFRDAPCRTMQLRPGKESGTKLERILVPAGLSLIHI